ncbi:hypothetical protein GCM10027089_35140 [Nocardia thraciensis]
MTVDAIVMAVTACCPVSVRPGSQDTTQRSPPTQRAMCRVISLVIIDADTTSIATDLLPSCFTTAKDRYCDSPER